MEIVTLEEMLDSLREGIETELDSEGLASWSLNASGLNISDGLEYYEVEDLKELRAEIREGAKVELTIDLSEYLLNSIDSLIEENDQQERDSELEEYDIEYLDEDLED